MENISQKKATKKISKWGGIDVINMLIQIHENFLKNKIEEEYKVLEAQEQAESRLEYLLWITFFVPHKKIAANHEVLFIDTKKAYDSAPIGRLGN